MNHFIHTLYFCNIEGTLINSFKSMHEYISIIEVKFLMNVFLQFLLARMWFFIYLFSIFTNSQLISQSFLATASSLAFLDGSTALQSL